MALFNEPSNLVKVAEYFGDLGDVIYKFDINMIPYTKIPNEVKGFMLYKTKPQSYLLKVHHDMGNESMVKTGYNLIFDIISHSFEFNDFIRQEFEDKTGIRLRDAPDSLCKFLETEGMGLLAFKLCEENGENAMKILKGNL